MIDSKKINIIVALAVCVALITGLLLVGFSSREHEPTVPEYATALFGTDIITIDIVADTDEWQTMLDNALNEEYIMVDVVVNGKKFSNVGIRPKGNSSLTQVATSDSDRYSFRLKFDEYVKDQTCFGLESFVVNNIQGDSTYMKEYLSYGIMREAGVETPYFGYTSLSLNGENWGLYLAIELYNDSYLARMYGDTDARLYNVKSMEMGNMGNRQNGDETGGSPMPGGFGSRPDNRPEDFDPDSMPDGFQPPDGFSGGQDNSGQSDSAQNDSDGTQTLNVQSLSSNMAPPDGAQGGNGRGGRGNRPENFDPDNMPDGFDPGNRPDGFDPGNMPDGFDPNNMPDGFDPGNRPDASQGDAVTPTSSPSTPGDDDASSATTDVSPDTSSDASDDAQTSPSQDTTRGNNGLGGDFGGRAGMGAMGGNTGGSLQYIDDEPSSYSAIFGNEVGSGATTSDYKKVIAALEALSEGRDLETYFDVDQILRYLAAHTVVVNLDSYSSSMAQNYCILERDGEITILPWDYNLSWGGFQSGAASSVVNFPIDTPVSGVTMEDRPLLEKLFAVPEYLEAYHQYMQDILDNTFADGKLDAKIDALNALIAPYVEADPTAFYTYDQYVTGVEALKELCNLRAESIQGQLDGTVPSTTDGQTANPELLIDASAINLSDLGSMGGGMGGGMGRGNWIQNGNATETQPDASGGASGNTSGDQAAGNPPTPPDGGGQDDQAPGDGTAGQTGGEAQTGDAQGDNAQNGNPRGGGQWNMLDRDVIEQAMSILQSADGDLTDEQRASLVALGLTDEQIEMIQNGFGNRQNGWMNGNGGGLSQNGTTSQGMDTGYALTIAGMTALLLLGTLLVAKTRRKY